MERTGQVQGVEQEVYSPAARRFHWWTVAFIAAQVPVGIYMVWRGAATKFDPLTGTLYDVHKLTGFLILWLVVLRLIYRFSHGAPSDEPTIEWWQRVASHLTHWAIYVMLIVIPVLGWLGVSLYGARSIFGAISLPALAAEDQDAAVRILELHKWAAFLLLGLLGTHIGAALFHHFIRRDGVLRRMLPGLRQRG